MDKEMNKSLLLSGEQLLELKCFYQEEKKMRRKKKRSHSGKFDELPLDMGSTKQNVDLRLTENFKILGTKRVRLSSDMGLAEWCPQSKSSKVISSKKRSPWMGFTENGQLMYTPEETIFLMEAECILVNYMDAQLSLQSAYQMILSDNLLGKYQIYAHLTRSGFKLKSSRSDNTTGSVQGINSSLDTKTIKDALNQKINQLGSKPILMASNNNLTMITMPLRRQMFLNGTSFDRTATWSEYKRLIEPRENPSVIFDEEATVLEVNDEIRSTENIFDQLPNKSLIDYTNNLKPLIDQTKFIDINKLHEMLKKSGPQERNLHKLLPPSKYQPEINYQAFSATMKNFSSIEPDHLVVICSDPFPPMVQELISINEKCGQSTPIYAIKSTSEFSLATLKPFDLWDEIPTFWDSNKSPR